MSEPEYKTEIVWYVMIAVKIDGTVDRYVRKDGKLQLVGKGLK